MRSIWVTFSQEGVHYYPGADTNPDTATGDWDDVSFLGYKHRHIFHFKVWIEVFHDDRDIEFIQFKRWLQRLYNNDSVLELKPGPLGIASEAVVDPCVSPDAHRVHVCLLIFVRARAEGAEL